MKYIKDLVKINPRCYALKIKQETQYRVIFTVLNKKHNIIKWELGGALQYTAGEFHNEIDVCYGCIYTLKIATQILREFKIKKKQYENHLAKNNKSP